MHLSDIMTGVQKYAAKVAAAMAATNDNVHAVETAHPLVAAAVAGFEREYPGVTAAVQGIDAAILDGARQIASDAGNELAKEGAPAA